MEREGKEKNSHQIGENNHILKLASQPDQIQRVIVRRHLRDQRGGIIATYPGAPVGVHADTKIPDPRLQVRVADDVSDGGVDVVVDLRRVGDRRVLLVIDGEEEDIRDEG